MNEEFALALPEEDTFKKALSAINRFQQIVHANLVKDLDYGIIPGTAKPTLLKPGAEKVAKLLGLSDEYNILDKEENWKGGFFHYLVKCRLSHIASGSTVSEGLGECNSLEAKYRYRWVSEKEIPSDIDNSAVIKKWRKTKSGTYPVYRIPNDDIYTLVNTLVKMAKKRALVDAALSAGRLSNVFSQDIEDIGDLIVDEESKEEKVKADQAVAPDDLDTTTTAVALSDATNPYVTWLTNCPLDDKEWAEGQYGKYHRSKDGGFHSLKNETKDEASRLFEVFSGGKEAFEQRGKGKDVKFYTSTDFKEWLEINNWNGSWAQNTEAERLDILGKLKSSVDRLSST